MYILKVHSPFGNFDHSVYDTEEEARKCAKLFHRLYKRKVSIYKTVFIDTIGED